MRKPTWNCPVCDSKALYENLMIDGYFLDVLQSDKMPKDENEIILERVSAFAENNLLTKERGIFCGINKFHWLL